MSDHFYNANDCADALARVFNTVNQIGVNSRQARRIIRRMADIHRRAGMYANYDYTEEDFEELEELDEELRSVLEEKL